MYLIFFFFFKQKTAYEISVRDWSSDVCSSDLCPRRPPRARQRQGLDRRGHGLRRARRGRSEERRVGKECERWCRARWSPDHEKKKKERKERRTFEGDCEKIDLSVGDR